MKNKYLVQIGDPYFLGQIRRVGKKNYILTFGRKVNKETMWDDAYYPKQWRFATDEDIKNYENHLKLQHLERYKDTLNELLEAIENFKDFKYLSLSDDFYTELEETIMYIKEELQEEQEDD